MITKNVEGKHELDIFRRFIVDKNLPKHKSIEEYAGVYKSGGFLSIDSDNLVEGGSWTTKSDSYSLEKFTIIGWILNKINSHKKAKDLKKSEMSKVPVETVFNNISENFQEIKLLNSRLEKHRAAISYAEKMGQTALLQDLKKKQSSIELEEVLFVSGYKQYIEETGLIAFALDCERGLRLDWIKNFTRMIPIEAGEKKIHLDKLCVFDNYVILHYDPKGESTKLTDDERKKKEDPILFGVIEGSRRLYHIHSWKDELCDLTIDQIIEKHPEVVKTLE